MKDLLRTLGAILVSAPLGVIFCLAWIFAFISPAGRTVSLVLGSLGILYLLTAISGVWGVLKRKLPSKWTDSIGSVVCVLFFAFIGLTRDKSIIFASEWTLLFVGANLILGLITGAYRVGDAAKERVTGRRRERSRRSE